MSNVTIIRDASSDWLEIARLEGDEIFIFSPFITGESVKDILSVKGEKALFIFTSLKMSSVLSGSLELKILLELMESGASIWHHETLHAKIIYSSQHGVIGSQNFTRGGKQNLEASVKIVMSDENIEQMSSFIEEAKEDAVLLSKEDIRSFEAECGKIKSENPKLIKKLVEPKIFKSALEKKKTLLENREKSLSTLIDEINKSGQIQYKVRLTKKKWKSDWAKGTYHTLVRKNKDTDFHYNLKSKLCMVLGTNKLFFIKKNHTQITQFFKSGRYLFHSHKIRDQFGYFYSEEGSDLNSLHTVSIKVHLYDPTETEDAANIHIQLSTFFYDFDLRLHFNGLEIIEISKSEKITIQPVTWLDSEDGAGDYSQHFAYPNFVARQSFMVSELQDFFQTDKFLECLGENRITEWHFDNRTYLERLFVSAKPDLFINWNYRNIMNFLVLGSSQKKD